MPLNTIGTKAYFNFKERRVNSEINIFPVKISKRGDVLFAVCRATMSDLSQINCSSLGFNHEARIKMSELSCYELRVVENIIK